MSFKQIKKINESETGRKYKEEFDEQDVPIKQK